MAAALILRGAPIVPFTLLIVRHGTGAYDSGDIAGPTGHPRPCRRFRRVITLVRDAENAPRRRAVRVGLRENRSPAQALVPARSE
jgi:hypothetical protein